ncbi:MAG TPA: heme biosynthesis HemY N-terminal domain-containing protein [Candidatus Contendobacter sp.]|nr:heme biosynthesis HemY N-terminal domain-containing protein [Candidatus Contendobacter sp.]HRZ22761.1 heme biosynthesis HemY N-terminal domain-containing protein [Candidatus Contendobacter sp.]HRZ51949.1 heme biosynthesis HemY N-terminal domain-containing protein [Candidatus Contendobacter sp.]
MKLLIGIIITLFVSVWMALALRQDPGYAMFSIGQWTVETSFAFLMLVLTAVFVAFYFLVRLAIRLWHTPSQTLAAHQRRLQRKARRLFNLGSRQLAAGQWAAAEKTLLKSAAHSETPALDYLSAARAVHHLSDVKWRRDLHLRKAEESPDADKLTVQLTRVEFLLDDQQAEQARPVLESLRTLNPRHPGVLLWLTRCYRQLGAWEPLQQLLPELQKQKVFGPESFADIERETYHARLQSVAAGGSLEQLRALWKQAPASVREGNEALLVDYATALCEFDAFDDAEALLREAINRRWSTKLVVGYGMLGRGNAAAQLAAAENWLAQHGDDPHLLLTLGRLAKRCQQPAKARNYLERSIQLMPTPDAYQELGELLESLHELTYAGQCFHAGLRLLVGKPQEQQGVTLPAAEAAQQLQGPVPSPAPAVSG